jgi:hypothetical protein
MPGRPIASLAPLALVASLAPAACYREVAAPAATAPGAPAAEAEAGWATSLEFEMDEKEGVLKHRGLAMFSVETRLPVFRSEPPGVAAALNARLARLARPDVDPSTRQGKYELDCTVALANRYAVILDCSQLLEERTHEEAARAKAGPKAGPKAGAPADPRRLVLGWWLRRGLPDLSLEQFAPRFDLRAAIDEGDASQLAGCELRACVFDPKRFVLDGDGITLAPTEACPSQCDTVIPSIPLDALAPAHVWAMELVKRVRRRTDAGDTLVEGDRTN